MKSKRIIFTIIIFGILSILYTCYIQYSFVKEKKSFLDQQNEKLELSYISVHNSLMNLSDFFVNRLINRKDVINLFEKNGINNETKKNEIRDSLYNLLIPEYEYIKTKDIKQLHFHSANNESFLRFHRPYKFGDDLTDIRHSVKMTNKTKRIYSGFEEGRIVNGFRYVSPLYSGTEHIGSVECSFSFGAIKNQFKVLGIQNVGFLIKKDIVETKVFESELGNYIPSLLSDDYYHEIEFLHYKNNDDEILKRIDNSINKKIQENFKQYKNFTVCEKIDNKCYIISFILIKNTENKPAAYIFSYQENNILPYLQKQHRIIQIVGIIILILLELFVIMSMRYSIKIEKINNKLSQKEEKLRTVANFTYDWEYWTDTDGNFIYISPSCQRITGYSQEDFFNNKELLHKIIHPEDKNIFHKHKHSINEKGERDLIEFRIITKNNKTEWIGHLCLEVYDKHGNSQGIRGSNRIITEQKNTEDALKEAVATKDKFFSIIAHDLKSPFNSILGFSNILLTKHKEFDETKREQFIKFVNESANSAFCLLDNLLTWARSQSGKINYSPEKHSLKDLINQTINTLNKTASKKDIQILCNVTDNEIIYADKNMISTIFRNLISNAIKFTNTNGTIIISSEPSIDNNFTQIKVKDSGIGIETNRIKDLFRIDQNTSTKGTEEETGTGLGLILCKEFIEKHGGKIWVESQIGKGSSFIFTIPQTLKN